MTGVINLSGQSGAAGPSPGAGGERTRGGKWTERRLAVGFGSRRHRRSGKCRSHGNQRRYGGRRRNVCSSSDDAAGRAVSDCRWRCGRRRRRGPTRREWRPGRQWRQRSGMDRRFVWRTWRGGWPRRARRYRRPGRSGWHDHGCVHGRCFRWNEFIFGSGWCRRSGRTSRWRRPGRRAGRRRLSRRVFRRGGTGGLARRARIAGSAGPARSRGQSRSGQRQSVGHAVVDFPRALIASTSVRRTGLGRDLSKP